MASLLYVVNDIRDVEADRPHVQGMVVRQLSPVASNWRATQDLHQYLAQHDIPGITEVDTRALTRHIRQHGALRATISTGDLEARYELWRRLRPRKETVGERHGRPELDTAYRAPRNEIESAVAEIWQQLLGIERIGIDDNFFDLGGASLQALQAAEDSLATFQRGLLSAASRRRFEHEGQLLARLRQLINRRVVQDPEDPEGYRIEVGPFPGWATVPEW